MAKDKGPSTRERLVYAARDLFWSQGYAATSIKDVLERAGVQSGSLYYFFPTKRDLLLAVLELHKARLWPEVMEPALTKERDPIEGVFVILDGYRQWQMATGFRGGCPIGNLALELSDHDEEVSRLIAENFEGWRRAVREFLLVAGGRLKPEANADRLATLILVVMEGSVMLCRAQKSITPFDEAVAGLRDYVNRLLAAPPASGRGERGDAGDDF